MCANAWLHYESLTEVHHYDVLNRWDNEKQRRIRDGEEKIQMGRAFSPWQKLLCEELQKPGFKAADKRPVPNDYMI